MADETRESRARAAAQTILSQTATIIRMRPDDAVATAIGGLAGVLSIGVIEVAALADVVTAHLIRGR